MKKISTFMFLLAAILVQGQENSLQINPNIRLPQDSLKTQQLVASLNAFLGAVEEPNEENDFVKSSEKIETFVLMDELKGIQKSGKYNDVHFYKPYLTNVVSISDSSYLLEVSYIGVHEGVPFYRAGFEFIAWHTQDSFIFSSPLLAKTNAWKTTVIGNTVFHHQQELNEKNVENYLLLTAQYDQKLGLHDAETEFYCCHDLTELLEIIGVTYKADYNGQNQNVLSATLGNKKLMVLGNEAAAFNEMDPHDLWHDRLSRVTPRSLVNRAVDEGCAYLYGGSWGLTWNEIFTEFVNIIASNPKADWADFKENPVYFKTLGYDNDADHIVNALLVQKIEKEHGFKGVWTFLKVGLAEAGNAKYYATLETLTGITRANYNKEIWKLIRAEQEK